MQNANLLIVNHALFFVDLSLRRSGISLLPDYGTVILDEAHTIEQVAGNHLGLSISNGQIDFALNKLYNDRTNKGLLVHHKVGEGQRSVNACRHACEIFFNDLMNWAQRNSDTRTQQRSFTLRVKRTGIVNNTLSPALTKLSQMVRAHGEQLETPTEKQDLISAGDRLDALATTLENWRLQQIDDEVYWIESSTNRAGWQNIKLMAAPIDIGPELRENLFNKVDSCIMTSATISVGNSSFDFYKNRVGLTQVKTLLLGSPFDYGGQVRIIIVSNMEDPTRDRDTHQRQSIDAIQHYVARTDGHAFVLCTSYDFLNRAVRDLTPWLAANDYAIYSQGSGTDRSQLLEKFRRHPRGVLFGTDSFWQGVDVQGDALQNVIITKLPFSVPDHPLLEARIGSDTPGRRKSV